AMHVPESLSDEEAGALPEVFLTAFLNIFLLGEVLEGGSVLVHGGGGGVGTAAISLCREGGQRVLVTAGSHESCQRCVERGAHVDINYRDGDFAARVREATGGRGVDVVLDSIGARYLASNLAALAIDGRLVIIGLMGGGHGEIDLAGLLMRRQRVIGSGPRTRSVAAKAAIVSAFVAKVGGRIDAGRVRPGIYPGRPLEEAAEAHRIMKASEHFGKIVLRVA